LKLARALCLAWCLGAGAGGCESDLDRSLAGLRCTTDWRCVEGYSCDPASMLCVRNGLADAGGASSGASAGGSAASMGGAGAGGSGVAGNGGHAGGGGNGGNAGNGGLLAGQGGGAGGAAVDPDAGLDDADGGDACVPATVYRDQDGDGFGNVQVTDSVCPGGGWVTNDTDCRDDLADVKPGLAEFFGVGYEVAGGGVSFDYDCSNAEEPSPTNETNDPAPSCPATTLGCEGRGFLPASEPPRQGAGVDPRCGSIKLRECQVSDLLGCETIDTDLAGSSTFLCH
jgi:hypothetical protein